jgi:acetyl esterase
VAIGGDSAGANLAAVVSVEGVLARRPAAQLLIYPATDLCTPRPSQQLFAHGFALTHADRDAFFHHYVHGTPFTSDDPRLSVVNAAHLSDAPAALVVVAGFDVLRDEGEAYASALENAGVPVRLMRFPGLEHGFIHSSGVSRTAHKASIKIANEWGGLLGQVGQLGRVGQVAQGQVGQMGQG